jgi:hypothetical protein
MGWDGMGWDGIGWDGIGYGMGMAAGVQMHSQPAPARVRGALSPRRPRSQPAALSDVRERWGGEGIGWDGIGWDGIGWDGMG